MVKYQKNNQNITPISICFVVENNDVGRKVNRELH